MASDHPETVRSDDGATPEGISGPAESKVEAVKRNSRHLRGTIAETLTSEATHFSEQDVQVLKFHGTYQQDDRDVRHERRKQGLESAYQFMVRVAVPAGTITADQYLALDELADKYGDGTLRVTTRQGFQLHRVLKKNLKAAIAGINETLITTLSACGDVERNVMACPAPLADPAHATLRRVAREIAVELRPKSRAYHEIWLDAEKAASIENEEPFYGETYLPRKFKTGLTLADDNCIDIYAYDLGFLAFSEAGRLVGYNVVVGGGLGMTHNTPDTFAGLAEPLGYIEPAHAVEAARTVAGIFRDYGDRADRRRARLKYLLNQWGIERFRGEFRRRASFELAECRPMPRPIFHDHLGAHPTGDGKWFYGVRVENGRIKDDGETRIKSALRTVASQYRPGIALTAGQNVLLTGLDEAAIGHVERELRAHGVKPAEELSAVRRYSMACPALPTCGLAITEAERIIPSVVARLEQELAGLGLSNEPITVRMTGCPNACARPYTADIGFVGRRDNVYRLYVGGGLAGDRVADMYAADVATEDFIAVLQPLLASWAKHRHGGESLGDYYQRLIEHGPARRRITGKEDPTAHLVQTKAQA